MFVDDYSFGRIVINGKTYRNDVIVSKDWIKPNWWRKEGHSVCLEDIKDVAGEEIANSVVSVREGKVKVTPRQAGRSVAPDGP